MVAPKLAHQDGQLEFTPAVLCQLKGRFKQLPPRVLEGGMEVESGLFRTMSFASRLDWRIACACGPSTVPQDHVEHLCHDVRNVLIVRASHIQRPPMRLIFSSLPVGTFGP